MISPMTPPRVIREVNCVETTNGMLLYWDLYDHVPVAKTEVYGVDANDRQFMLINPLVSTGRLLIDTENYPLITGYKIRVHLDTGVSVDSDIIVPQKVDKVARRLINDMKRRTKVMLKATPIGSYSFKLLLRKIDGVPCERCGGDACIGIGGTGPSDSCPVCVGTGITDPYYLFPKEELMSGLAAVENESDLGQTPTVARELKIHTFLAVNDIHLRTNDILVSGIEVYRILKHTVVSSVAGAPTSYNLSCVKLLPEDPKYDVLLAMSKGVNK